MVILVYLQSVLVPSEFFARFILLLFVLVFTPYSSRPSVTTNRSELSASADLPGFRDPLLDILEKFLRLLQGLRNKVSNMVLNDERFRSLLDLPQSDRLCHDACSERDWQWCQPSCRELGTTRSGRVSSPEACRGTEVVARSPATVSMVSTESVKLI